MRVIVPVPLGWQSSLPIQMTRSPNASLRAIAVFMTMPPDDRPRKNEDRWAATLGDGTAFPLWRVIAHQSMFGYRPRTPCTLTMLNLASSSVYSPLLACPPRLSPDMLCIQVPD